MSIIDRLKEQHDRVRDLLAKILDEGDRRQRRAHVSELGRVFRLHARVEERLVYPAASKAFQGDNEQEERVFVSYEEHASAMRALEALEATPSGDKRFVARAKVLKTLIEQHIEEEESATLPQMEAKLGADGVTRLTALVDRRMSSIEQEFREQAAPAKPSGRPRPRRTRSTATTESRRVRATMGREGNRRREPTSRPSGATHRGRANRPSSGQARRGSQKMGRSGED